MSGAVANFLRGGGMAGREERSKYLGVTAPVSLALPRPSDLEKSKELEAVLHEHGLFESSDELNHRLQVLARINELVQLWIQEVSIAKGIPENVAQTTRGKIFTFGSYRLGVHTKGADIDTLCVAPRHVDRSDFFSSFVELLKQQPQVRDLRAVEEAFVPVIKMEFDGIELDMLFARLALKDIPPDQELRDMTLLKNLDMKCVRSLNGCRVTDEILHLVPDIPVFRTALRTIKLWAKKKGVYSNVLGYLGGVSWAMLVARTCQLYPHAAAATIIQKLFLVFSQWTWPKPVHLKAQTSVQHHIGGFSVWDPRTNVADRYHLMPIITPAYPEQNSTYNTSLSTRTIMTKAFKEGLETTEQILKGKATWHALFSPPKFFEQYKTFITLTAVAHTKDDLLTWYGLVESKIRTLITSIERQPAIEIAHINPQSYPVQPNQQAELVAEAVRELKQTEGAAGDTGGGEPPNPDDVHIEGVNWFIGLHFSQIKEKGNLDLTDNVRQLRDVIFRQAENIRILRPGMDINVTVLRKKDLPTILPADEVARLPPPPERKRKSQQRKASEGVTDAASGEPANKKQKTEGGASDDGGSGAPAGGADGAANGASNGPVTAPEKSSSGSPAEDGRGDTNAVVASSVNNSSSTSSTSNNNNNNSSSSRQMSHSKTLNNKVNAQGNGDVADATVVTTTAGAAGE